MKKLMFLSLALGLVFTACKKNRDEEPVHKNLLIKRTDSDGLVFTYTYDAANRMSGYAMTSNPYNSARNYTFTYNANGSLAEYVEANSSLKGKLTYNPDGTLASKKEYSVSGAVETLVNTYTYTYVGGMVNENYVYAPTGNGFRDECKYDANGNITEQKSYTTTVANPAGTYSVTVTYGNYDNKNNASESYPAAFLFPISIRNNRGSLAYSTGGFDTYAYEYNADGYPTKRTMGTEISVFEYRRL